MRFGFRFITIAVAAAGALAVSSPSSPAETYCGSTTTPANGNCWFSDSHSSGRAFTVAYTQYSGPTPYENCARLGYFPRQTQVWNCQSNNSTVQTGWCTGGIKDAAVGNKDNYGKILQGTAYTGTC